MPPDDAPRGFRRITEAVSDKHEEGAGKDADKDGNGGSKEGGHEAVALGFSIGGDSDLIEFQGEGGGGAEDGALAGERGPEQGGEGDGFEGDGDEAADQSES